jgi:hypothetical protein
MSRGQAIGHHGLPILPKDVMSSTRVATARLAPILRPDRNTPMLGNVIAAWLIFLTLSPFTAPFPTCELAILFTEHAPPGHGPSPPTSLADAALSQALPLVRTSGRVRFIALSELKTASDGLVPPATAFSQPPKPTSHSTLRLSPMILRI